MRSDRGQGALILLCAAILAAGCGSRHAPISRPDGPAKIVLAEGPPVPAVSYAGSAACLPCHGAVYAFWSGTAHAGSLARLASSGDGGNPSCLRCHATGFGEGSGYGDAGASGGLGAVGCESCHGPAALHASNPEAATASAQAGRDCPPCEIQKVCRRCHTLARSPEFQLARDLAAVACRNGRSGAEEEAAASGRGGR